MARRRDERGSAVVDFVLVLFILVPLLLGILQVALVLHIRNTLTAAASQGARLAATADHGAVEGVARARRQIAEALSERYVRDVSAVAITINGAPAMEVRVRADVPPLGLWGPGLRVEVTGHAIEEPAASGTGAP